MVESATAPKKHLALDTDWMSATMAICAFLIFGLLGAGMAWRMLQGKVDAGSVTWWAPLFAAGLIYLGVESRDKVFRVAVLVFAIGPASRTALWLARSSTETRVINEAFVAWLDIGLFFGICVYVTHWFKAKLTHV